MLAAADVVDGIGRDGQTILALLAFGGLGHHADYSLYDIINVGKVPAAVAIVVNLYCLPGQQFVGEAEVCHVRTSGRAVNGEEPQTCGRDIVQLGVAMCEEFVALLGCRIEAHGIVHTVIGAEGNFLVSAVDAGR